MKTKSSFYTTTPIYYANGSPHIGHAYTTLLADTLGRFHRLFEIPVRFTTGTDEHGQKVEEVAKKNEITPQAQADRISAIFQQAWQELGIDHQDFIRTTEERHKKVVRQLVLSLMEKGDIYKDIYRGWYLVEDEDFYPDTRVREISDDPENDPRLQRVEEENYFFRLSHYTEKLKQHYQDHPAFVLPRNRRNEMLAMLDQGLDDISVSRASVKWGIPVPGDSEQVIYVWVEALMNYLTSVGGSQNEEVFQTFWPPTCQIVGKDILKFHAIIWPALLLALDLPLPQTILAHGWILSGGEKMSKSKGNTQDPLILSKTYGNDALRFTLFRELSLGQDGNYDSDILIKRYNSELANDLGNLVQRTLGFARKRIGGPIQRPEGYPNWFAPKPLSAVDNFDPCWDMASGVIPEALSEFKSKIERYEINQALDSLWLAVRSLNQAVDQAQPWRLAKEDPQKFILFTYFIADALSRIANAASPFLPDTCRKILEILGQPVEFSWKNVEDCSLPETIEIQEFTALFPKIKLPKIPPPKTNTSEATPKPSKSKEKTISMDDFSKIRFEVVTVAEAKPHPDADKLLVLTLSTSQGKKQVVAGIANFYEPADLPGQTIVMVRNLEPVEIRGVLSEGMVLAASNRKELSLITTDRPVQEGSKVS
jgi:methionyl-tRNA synthetase